jgi:UDP-N-acetylmuramate dehydrogenase
VSGLAELARVGASRVVLDADLGSLTTYRVGGRVAALVTLEDRRDLEELGPLVHDCGRPVVVVGNGSNLLVADGFLDLVALRLGEGFAGLASRDEPDGAVAVSAGAALDLPVAARRLSAQGIVGFEWAVGVPGTFGGAVVMNAGGHGSQMAACVTRVHTWSGGDRTWTAADLRFGYRTSALGPADWVLEVEMRLERGDPEASRERLGEIVRWRRAHQPGGANAGSVFANPPHDSAGRLVEAAGLKGLRVGSAAVSEKHANFILVDEGGSAGDVYALMRLVRDRVQAATGVELAAENRLIGFGVDP